MAQNEGLIPDKKSNVKENKENDDKNTTKILFTNDCSENAHYLDDPPTEDGKDKSLDGSNQKGDAKEQDNIVIDNTLALSSQTNTDKSNQTNYDESSTADANNNDNDGNNQKQNATESENKTIRENTESIINKSEIPLNPSANVANKFTKQENNSSNELMKNVKSIENNQQISHKSDDNTVTDVGNQEKNATKSESENTTLTENILDKNCHENQSNIEIPPIGLPNPSAYCYLNSILQTLFSCQDFREKIIGINQKHLNNKSIKPSFVVGLGNLFFYVKERNENKVENAVKSFYKYFDETIFGDDIHKCYLQILKKISDEIKTTPETYPKTSNKTNISANDQFKIYEHKNKGFIFELFCGQLSFKTMCKSCKTELFEKFQLFKSMPLQIRLSDKGIQITECIKSFFEESKIDITNVECCINSDIISLSQITHSPQFIFIYFVRGAYNLSESKNNTFVKFDNYINIPTVCGNILYKLRSVIDHLSGNESGHYFMKTVSGSDWYLINDVQVKKINPTDVPTKNAIGLLIEKVTNFDENIPEPLINYNENFFYQNAFQSILQMIYQCCDIRQYFIELFTKENTNENVTQNLNFKQSLGKLFHYMREMNEKEIQNAVENLNKIFENSINKDNIHNCYLQILNKINQEIKLSQKNHSESDNETNISDRFCGRISFEARCDNKACNTVFNKTYQLCVSLALPIPSIKQNTTLSECIEKHFEKSEVEGSELQCCETQKIISISQLTHSPQFLFIYLVRVTNNNTFVEFDNYIDIPTVNGNVLYKLRSVIDRCHENEYLVKMILNSTWWLKKDCRFRMVNPKNVSTQLSIGLLFEKVTNINHNIPEPLIIDKYNYKYQNYLKWIVKYLYLCCDIRKHLIDFYKNNDTSDNITENFIFKRKIGEMMVLFDEQETGEIKMLLRETLNFLSIKIYNIDQLYCCIMDKLNDKINNINTNAKQQSAMPEPDLFRGQISIYLKCKLSEKIFIEGIKTFKSITIHGPTSKEKSTIDECIENVLENPQVKCESDLLQNNESSDKQQIISINQLTNPPQFILIYLVRKYNDVFEFNNYINIPTLNGNVLYKLRYVIDQMFGNQSTYYVVKTLSDSNWLWKRDYEMKNINPADVPTKYSIVLLIEKVTNIDHNVPETLINHNYLYEEALQSIIQMLYECLNIRKYLIDFYTSDHFNENITENLIFKRKIGEVMFLMEHGNESGRITNLLKAASNFLPNKLEEIHELYLWVMNKLNEKESHFNANLENNDSMDECGVKRSRLQCKKCKNYIGDISKPQIFKSLYLKSKNIKFNLSKRIENFCTSQFDNENKINNCCKNPQIVMVEEILSSPKYLFIYLDRIEGTIENNNDIKLNTQSGDRHYSLHVFLKYSTIRHTNDQTKRKFSIIKYESESCQKPKNVFESVIAVMMVRKDDNISISNSENSKECANDMKTEDQSNLHSKISDKIGDNENIDNSVETQLAEESLKSDFIADSIKQIIELNKDNKIYVLLGLLFSCTLFRNIMINFHKNNEIKKLFKRFAVDDIGIFVNGICMIYDHVTGQKEISPINQLDNNLSIHQCFNYIFDNIKFIMENKEFNKAIKFNSPDNLKIICDNFYGTFSLERICKNFSKSHKFEDTFSNLCVKKPQNDSSVNLEKFVIEYGFEKSCQQDEKCGENHERKIIHAPKILFICVDEQSRKSNPDCILHCDSIMQIDTTAGSVAYSLVSILDQNDSNMYAVKFVGNSGWWQAYPHSRKINDHDLFTKYNVGFLFKKLE